MATVNLIFDIGANVGAYALANKHLTERMIAVEASPLTFAKLEAAVSSDKTITPLNFAVSDIDQPYVDFFHCKRADTISTTNIDWLTSSESRFGDCNPEEIEKLQVPSISLDSLIQRFGRPDLLKIDVEGAEHSVIRSLSQKIPVLCFEWASEMREVAFLAINELVRIGFSQFHIQNQDSYTYRPNSYELSAEQTKSVLLKSIDKVDWGMVWAM